MRRDDDFTRYGRTIRVEGGLKAQSTRGAIGESWWSRRFITVLESFALGSRLTRGRNYARAGQVLSLDVDPGEVTASVQGSRPRPYAVTIGLTVLSDQTWSTIEAALAEQALFGARLLAGEMPKQIEEVFTSAGAALFPTSARQLAMHCSCPDSTVPCKHIAATFYLLAEAFDADPFRILHWRGRDRESLLARLRALRSADGSAEDNSAEDGDGLPANAPGRRRRTGSPKAGSGRARPGSRTATASRTASMSREEPMAAPVTGAAIALAELTSPDLAETVDRFWVAPVPLPTRPPTLDTDVDLLLRQLPAPPAALGGAELVTRLRALYSAFAPPGPSQSEPD